MLEQSGDKNFLGSESGAQKRKGKKRKINGFLVVRKVKQN